MTAALAFAILGLALFDSTSAGTLLVPLWLLLSPGRVRAGRIGAYLLTIAVAYWAAGVLVALAAAPVLDWVGGVLDSWSSVTVPVLLLVLGVGCVGAGALMLTPTYALVAGALPSRLQEWRTRTLEADSGRALVVVALIAFAVEFGGMAPYLGAIGLLTRTELDVAGVVAWIAAYCAIMILPALVLTAVRVVGHAQIAPALGRLDAWIESRGTQLTAASFMALGMLVAAYGVYLLAG